MKNSLLLTILMCISSIGSSLAQNTYRFSFESNIPAQWNAQQGNFYLNTEHFSDGSQSLCWIVPANSESTSTVSFNAFGTEYYACLFNIYSLKATENTMLVEFLDSGGNAKKTATVSMNFKGWRDFNRSYAKDFTSGASTSISMVRFTYKNNTTEPQKVFLDNVNFRAAADANRQATDLMVLDINQIEASRTVLLKAYSYMPDIAITEPTSQQLTDLGKVKSKYLRPSTTFTNAELVATREYIDLLNITRNTDQTVKGNVMPSSSTDLTTNFLIDITRKLEIIAMASKTNETDKIYFNNFLEYIIDQGFIYKFPRLVYSDYTTVRTIPAQLMNVIPVCSTEQVTEVLKMAKWITEFGIVYADQSYLKVELNSDYIYLFLPYLYSSAVYQPDNKLALRDLKALSRFVERSTLYSEGSNEILKIDGTGFHHKTHYNVYMYAYNTWINVTDNLRGTSLQISEDSYNRIKKAIVSKFIMSNKAVDGTNYYANSLSGRSTLLTGRVNRISQTSFEKLIAVGGDIQKKSIDEDLAAAYNCFFVSNKYSVPQANYEGYYQFNYSPIGIYRHNNWVATMRAPTTKFWGAEIYSTANRFGRYQSHGSLEIVYDGKPELSGMPTIAKGWDWNVIPGTTTVHYTSWQEMMPARNTSQRFDQYTKTKNFAGALAWDKCGIFASDFDQIDSWGSEHFTPTNLEFKKSVYSFDGMLISMGSNITSAGNYSNDMITATNLFQSIKSASSGNLNINGQTMSAGSSPVTNASVQDFWMITPDGTGYFVPKENDNIVIKYTEQAGPNQSGEDVATPATAVAAKAYINHGVKPSDKKYLFVVVPSTDQEKMQELASKMVNRGGDVFKIESQTQELHALTYKPQGITAYSFFAPTTNLAFGLIKEATSEMLLMQKTLDDGRISFALSNPNLRPQQTGIDDRWKSTPTSTSITLNGKWYANATTTNVTVDAPSNNETKVHFTLSEGEPLYFNLQPENYTSIEDSKYTDWVRAYTDSTLKELIVEFAEMNTELKVVELYSLDGQRIDRQTTSLGNNIIRFNLNDNSSSIAILHITSGSKTKSLKIITS